MPSSPWRWSAVASVSMRRVAPFAVETAQLLGAEVEVELGMVHPFALGSQQLDQLGAAVGLRGAEDLDEVRSEIGHQHSCVRARAGSPHRVACSGPLAAGVARPGARVVEGPCDTRHRAHRKR